jgi:hypothetical protein
MQGRTGTDSEEELMPVKANRNDPRTPLLRAANICDRGHAGAQEENPRAVLPKAATALIRAGSAAAHAGSVKSKMFRDSIDSHVKRFGCTGCDV